MVYFIQCVRHYNVMVISVRNHILTIPLNFTTRFIFHDSETSDDEEKCFECRDTDKMRVHDVSCISPDVSTVMLHLASSCF